MSVVVDVTLVILAGVVAGGLVWRFVLSPKCPHCGSRDTSPRFDSLSLPGERHCWFCWTDFDTLQAPIT